MKRRAWLLLGMAAFWLSWPALWIVIRGSQRTRLLLIHQDSVLVVRGWMSDGRWQLPGGGLHRGERPAKGVVREVQEETGLQLDTKEVRVLATEPYHSRGFRYTCRYFIARVDRPLHLAPKGLEIAEAAWIDRGSLTPNNANADVLRALALMDGSK